MCQCSRVIIEASVNNKGGFLANQNHVPDLQPQTLFCFLKLSIQEQLPKNNFMDLLSGPKPTQVQLTLPGGLTNFLPAN